jgi:hypothetical protein
MRVFKLAASNGALYSSGKNLLADLKAWRLDDPEGVLASQGYSGYPARMAEACSRGAREVSWRGEIRGKDGGEATGPPSFRLRALPRPSGDASCRTKGASQPPSPGRPSCGEQRRHRHHLQHHRSASTPGDAYI